MVEGGKRDSAVRYELAREVDRLCMYGGFTLLLTYSLTHSLTYRQETPQLTQHIEVTRPVHMNIYNPRCAEAHSPRPALRTKETREPDSARWIDTRVVEKKLHSQRYKAV